MWDSEAPLKLLKTMPAQLNKENLRVIQEIIDVDKYKNSMRLKRDLCGEYAPFCENCNKNAIYPCAVAYVKMKQAEGMEIEIAVSDCEDDSPIAVTETNRNRIRIAIARRKR